MMPTGAIVASSTILTALSFYIYGGPTGVYNSVKAGINSTFNVYHPQPANPNDNDNSLKSPCNATIFFKGELMMEECSPASDSDKHFIDPVKDALAMTPPPDPFLPPFEILRVTAGNEHEIMEGKWLIVGMLPWCPFSNRIGPGLLRFLDGFGEAHLRVPVGSTPPIRVALLDIEENASLAIRLGIKRTPRLLFLSDGKPHTVLDIREEDLKSLGTLGEFMLDHTKWLHTSPKRLRRTTAFKLAEFKSLLRIYRFILKDQLKLVGWLEEHPKTSFGTLSSLLLSIPAVKLLSMRKR